MRESQRAVWRTLRERGPSTDEELVSAYGLRAQAGDEPMQSESGIRTRRAELVDAGWVADTGERRRLRSGRSAIVWRAVAHSENVRRAEEKPEPLFERDDLGGWSPAARAMFDPDD